MDEDENLRVHAEVCHVPISADRGVGSLLGYSLKWPQFLTNASCLSVLFLSHVAITSPQPQAPLYTENIHSFGNFLWMASCVFKRFFKLTA